jgi:hypothetical protein
MAVLAIYILVLFAGFLLWLGMNKADSWIVIFSGMLFIFGGLYTFLEGFGELTQVYYRAIAIIFIFFGAYITTRAGLEVIQETYN